jgi:hypothetical protein
MLETWVEATVSDKHSSLLRQYEVLYEPDTVPHCFVRIILIKISLLSLFFHHFLSEEDLSPNFNLLHCLTEKARAKLVGKASIENVPDKAIN